MNIVITERFDREEGKLKSKALSKQIVNLIENLPAIENIHEIPSLKRLKGTTAYRIRMGNYRLGVTIENDTITFHSIGHGIGKCFMILFPKISQYTEGGCTFAKKTA